MVSFISFVLPIYHEAATGFLFLSLLFPNQGHTNKQLSSLVDSHAYNPLFKLLCKIPLILYCEHLQHFTKETSSSYVMPLYLRLGLEKLKIAWQYLNNSLTVPSENSKWGVILFLSKVELTSLPSTGPIFSQKYLLLPFS